MKFFMMSFLFVNMAQAWTLNNNFGASFKDPKVKVYIDGGTACDLNTITVSELESMIPAAINDYWNKVPTTNLELEAAGFSNAIFTMNKGRLCSPTDAVCITAGTAAGSDGTPEDGLIPPVSEIVIACNDNPANFGDTSVLAVTVPNQFSGKKITGAVILINENSSGRFGALSRDDKIAVIAHEIGHAIGLGHSEDRSALMYFRTVSLRKNLGQDDIDGVSFLYPMQLDAGGLLGGCGMISDGKNPPKDPPFSQMLFTLGFIISLFSVFRLLRSPKARASFSALSLIFIKYRFLFRVK
jgi:hypothetical protein